MSLSSQTRTLIWWAVGALGTIGLIIGLAQLSAGPSVDNVRAIVAVNEADHVQGMSTAPVTIVEYSDLQCPACAFYHPIIQETLAKAGDKVRLVYRHFPLTTIHQYAQLAAQAAEAANAQGKFWEMQDLLFDRQTSWSRATDVKATLIDYAEELELDQAKFASDLDSSTIKDRVQRDATTAAQLRLSGTPSFFMNGEVLATPFTATVLLNKINEQAGS